MAGRTLRRWITATAVLAAVAGGPALPSAAQPEGAPPDAERAQGEGTEIVNGLIAGPTEFRFTVALVSRGQPDDFQAQFCGGSLIGNRRVLTAAHCVTDTGTTNVIPPNSVDVLVGTNLLNGSGERIHVQRIHVHRKWNPFTFANDLAALDLARPANQPLIRPAKPGQAGRGSPGASATVAGWGRLHPTDNVFPVDQRKGTATIRARGVCESAFPGPDFKYFHGLNICVGGNQLTTPGSCRGDSGGPLFNGAGSSRVQIGIVSFGRLECGTAPSVYTRVSAYSSPNDAFGQPINVPQGGGVRSAKTFTASKQPGEPAHAAQNRGGASVWFTWRAPRDRVVTISTAGSNFDTLLGVYQGRSVRNLTPVARNDDARVGVLTSKVTFAARAGTRYRIAVDGFNGAFGSASVRVS